MAYKRFVTCDGCGKQTTDIDKDQYQVSISNYHLGKEEEEIHYTNYDICDRCAAYLKVVLDSTIKQMQNHSLNHDET